MDEGSEFRDMRNAFYIFGAFGASTTSILGRNPFDDPFFTRPFGSEPRLGPVSKGPVIHELNSDDEGEGGQESEGDKDDKEPKRSKEPVVDYPDEEPKIGKNEIAHTADLNKAEGTRARTFQLHSCKVTYGGIDGAYYTSSSTRTMGDDGVLMEECKEADKRTGEAQHRISRGLHDKGHSLTRKLKADGEIETVQTLHNLNEDELDTFENSWRGNAGRQIPSSMGNSSTAHPGAGFHVGGMLNWVGLLPSSRRAWEAVLGDEAASFSIRQQPKKVVTGEDQHRISTEQASLLGTPYYSCLSKQLSVMFFWVPSSVVHLPCGCVSLLFDGDLVVGFA